MNRSHRGGHDHPDDDALTIGCSACIARVEHDQAEAAWAVAPLRRCTWTFDASLDASRAGAAVIGATVGSRVVVGRYLYGTDCDLTGHVGTITGVSDWRSFPISVEIDGHGLALFAPGELDAADEQAQP